MATYISRNLKDLGNLRTLDSPVYLRIYMNDKILEAIGEGRAFCLIEVRSAIKRYLQGGVH